MNKLIKKVSVLSLIAFAVLGLTGVALADNESPVKSFDDIIKVLQKALLWFATAFWIFAVGGSLYAGFLFLTAAGNTERVGKAKKQMVYVIIAIVIGLLAYGLPAILRNILTPSSANGNGNPPGGFVPECDIGADCSFDVCPGTGQCVNGSCACDPV